MRNIIISDSILNSVEYEIMKRRQYEVGGIILGNFIGDDFASGDIVLHSLCPPPEDSKFSELEFSRGGVGVDGVVSTVWPTSLYLGEWHKHPSCVVEPSEQDIQSLSEYSETMSMPILMLIIGDGFMGDNIPERPIRAWIVTKYLMYELNVVRK